MKVFSNSRFAPRDLFARLFVFCGLVAVTGAAHAQNPAPITNASPNELLAVQQTIAHLEKAAAARDANALAFFGASVPADNAGLEISDSITHIAVSPSGALVRLNYTLTIDRTPAVVLSSGTEELWLTKAPDGSFSLTSRRFVAPVDAVTAMTQAADVQLNNAGADDGPTVLDLVASRIGGRWIALRTQSWDGSLKESPAFNGVPTRNFIMGRMQKAPPAQAYTAHFMMQRIAGGWQGIGAAFNLAKAISPVADSASTLWRGRITTIEYVSASSHRDFGLTLGAVGLWNEAADELQKAELLQPGIIGPNKLKEADSNRKYDPQNAVAGEIEAEKIVGLAGDHPDYIISALKREQQAAPSALLDLRLALEYSRLADEQRAGLWSKAANELMQRNGVDPRNRDWVQLLVDHLTERARTDKIKPSNILHSALFTARVWTDDANAVQFLAALEEAQHTVYAGFGIPMGNTEVILWHDQQEFADYTTHFADEGGNEFVAALTLTKLVSTDGGPFILGEEVNTFADTRDLPALFGTVAHEYGHVAVRQLSKGHLVPVWFNEGIATSVEGGYDGYINRVRRAANAGTLLPMREMQAWNVDGDRAFLAYSEANSIVAYIIARWGTGAVLKILAQIGNNINPEDAFRRVLGISQSQLWDQWVREGIA